MEYNFQEIEQKWQKFWRENDIYKVTTDPLKPKYYVLDMFPYPSGEGLHVGHPLGYIASDIYTRYKRHKGFNVLHPMGFDSFGLPAEQYAIQTGQHPAETTKQNIARYKEQLEMMGFSYDWNREVRTSDPDYYKWTQWIFLKMFNSWYNKDLDKAEPIEKLTEIFRKYGDDGVNAVCSEHETFSCDEWNNMSIAEQQKMLINYRIAYLDYADVNWCPELGTVLANDEVKDGLSERGGFPVIRKSMRQWFLKITAYAERLLADLENLEWTDSMKEMQRNWIGRSEGGKLLFHLEGSDTHIEVFTTRPDTVYGSTFLVLAPEHQLVGNIVSAEEKDAVNKYIEYVSSRTERDRLSEVKTVTGAFTGAYAINPFTEEQIPIWISEYVLAGYGTGAIMAVPAHDSRDYAFAKKFNIEIRPVIEGADITEGAYEGKSGKMINSGIINGLEVPDAISKILAEAKKRKIGKSNVNFRLRDVNFSRQRYWGEPFPIVFYDGIPKCVPQDELPVKLPMLETYKPTGTGESPLANSVSWVTSWDGGVRETDTMPGFAGSSWYFLRYMSPDDDKRFVRKEDESYWKDVDLYIGGAEHAVGHLLYSRFFQKFLYDFGHVTSNEPFRKLVNQGMIQGRSNFVYRIKGSNTFVSYNLREQHEVTPLHVNVQFVDNDVLDLEKFRQWRDEFNDAEFILEDGKYICGWEVERMSKSKYNVVNPDDIVAEFGADTFRMFEMFLGPVEQAKPWNTKGIDGVSRFLRKLWRLYVDDQGETRVTDEKPQPNELKILHKTIKKVEEDIERFSFNTGVSALMICVNELSAAKTDKREILEPLIVLLSPYAPHLAEELWQRMGKTTSVVDAAFPQYNESYLKEDTYTYPVSINGKMRTKLDLPLNLSKDEIENILKSDEVVQKWTEGRQPKNVIYVKGKIINVVV